MLFQQARPAIHKLYDNHSLRQWGNFWQTSSRWNFLLNTTCHQNYRTLTLAILNIIFVKTWFLLVVKVKKSALNPSSRCNFNCGNYPLKNYLSIIPYFNASRVLIHTSISCPETALGLLLKLSSHVTPVILKSEDSVSEYKRERRWPSG